MSGNKTVLSLAEQLGKFQNLPGKLPPVESWSPELSGDMDMLIKKDGSWVHEGDEIKRDKLVRMFSTILRKEGADHYLLTPVEKWRIKVEDMPFIIVLAEIKSVDGIQIISLINNLGDQVELGENSFVLDGETAPYIEVRHGLNARLSRNVYYQLADNAEVNSAGLYCVKSNGLNHAIG